LQKKPQILIIGVDGGTLDLLLPWVREGKLPHFERLIREGSHGTLESTIPPVTAPAWTSFMTGQNPGKHRLFDFVEPQPGAYEMRYTSADSRATRSLWRILSENGKKVGVFNVPMTYPPEEVSGYLVSGMGAPVENRSMACPRQLFDELREKTGGVRLDIVHLGYMRTDERRDEVLRELLDLEENRTRNALYLMEKYPTDVMMVVYTSTDAVQHFFWHDMDPSHPQHDPARAEKYGDAVFRIYRNVDEKIGELLAAVPEETSVVVMSDHGAGPTGALVFYVNRFLSRLGLLRVSSGGAAGSLPGRMANALIRRIDPLIRGGLSSKQKGRLADLLPVLRRKWDSRRTSYSMIDWENTKAYCYEALTHPPGIWINTKGDRPGGIVNRGRDYDEILDFITEKLYEVKDPGTGERLIRRVHRKTEIYHGPYLHMAPDLTMAWWEGKPFFSRPSFSGPGGDIVEALDGVRDTGAEWSGSHRLHGFMFLRGAPFLEGKRVEGARIVDLAPTLLYLLDLPIPEDMDGRVLFPSLKEDFIRDRSVRYQAVKAGREADVGRTYSEEDAEKIQERLKSLGYME
jgi:predicted AlkP superfamily phosphohydrolase/phosphomutase